MQFCQQVDEVLPWEGLWAAILRPLTLRVAGIPLQSAEVLGREGEWRACARGDELVVDAAVSSGRPSLL